jgi:glycosyltransferase involved in cell wall biosynthesis
MVMPEIVYNSLTGKKLHNFRARSTSILNNSLNDYTKCKSLAGDKLNIMEAILVSERNSFSRPIRLLSLNRWHPDKDIPLMISALSSIRKSRPDLQIEIDAFGQGITNNNSELMRMLSRYDVVDCFNPKGLVTDVTTITSMPYAYHLLTSKSDSFPNAILDTMSMLIPNVTTPVGDAPFIVQGFGYVSATHSHTDYLSALLDAILFFTSSPQGWLSMASSASESILSRFSPNIERDFFLNRWYSSTSNEHG